MDDPPHDTNRLRTLLTACMILLFITAGTVAVVAQAGTFYEEGWESNSFDGYTTSAGSNALNEIQQSSVNSGLYALKQEVGDAGGSVSATVTTNDTYTFTPGDSVNVSYYTRAEWQVNENRQYFMRLRIVDDDTSDVILDVYRHEFDGSSFTGPDRGWIMKSDVMSVDVAEEEQASVGVESGDLEWQKVTVTSDGNDTDIVLSVDGTEVLTASNNATVGTEYNGTIQYRTQRTDGSGAGSGFTRSWFDDVSVEASPTPDRELELEASDYMRPGSEQTYDVTFFENELGTTSDVTDHANTSVSSDNTSVILVDEADNTLSAVDDENISDTVTITANYTHSDGNTYEDSVTITVAQATMKNFEILPSSWRINALFSWDMGSGDSEQDTLPLIILISIFAGGITARVVSSFAGIGAMLLIIVVGWFGGWVGTGVVLSALFVGLFIGFNLAANIDYAVRRG